MRKLVMLATQAVVFGCGGRPVSGDPVPLSVCRIEPVVGQPVVDRVRIVVADEALAPHFVRQSDDPGPKLDCEARERPVPAGAGAPGPAVEVNRPGRGVELRDLIDGGQTHLIVTRDPLTLGYARTRPELRVIPLPWDLTYILTAAPGAGAPEPPPIDERRALARDAVRADARGATPPFWWIEDPACGAADRAHPAPGQSIAYPANDPIARGLAERLVALAGMSQPPPWLAGVVPVAHRSRVRALPVTNEMRLDSTVLAAIRPVARYPASTACGAEVSRAGLPLIDSRASLIVRPEVPAFMILQDGSIEFLPRIAR